MLPQFPDWAKEGATIDITVFDPVAKELVDLEGVIDNTSFTCLDDSRDASPAITVSFHDFYGEPVSLTMSAYDAKKDENGRISVPLYDAVVTDSPSLAEAPSP